MEQNKVPMQETLKGEIAKKTEISNTFHTNTENLDAAKTPTKITHFFPVLRSRMNLESHPFEKEDSSDTLKTNINPNEVLQKCLVSNVQTSSNLSDTLQASSNSSDTMKISTKEQTASCTNVSADVSVSVKSETPKSLAKKGIPKVSGRNISELLNSALKTSISEALRKNKAKQIGVEKNIQKQTEGFEKKDSSSSKDLGINGIPIESEKSVSISQETDPKESKIEAQSNNSTDKLDEDNIQMRLKNAVKNSTQALSVVASQSAKQSYSSVVIKTEIIDPEETINSDNIDPQLSSKDSHGHGLSKELVADLVQPQNEVAKNKCRRNRKRHFKGATYSLYLTPNRKKKKLVKKDSSCKDDEMSLSTENGSCVDSSDGCSMFSDDFNTSSERSLADDEGCSNSRCSPVLTNVDQRVDTVEIKIEPQAENSSTSVKHITSNSELMPEACDVASSCDKSMKVDVNEVRISHDSDVKDSFGNQNTNIDINSNDMALQQEISEVLANCDNVITSKLLPELTNAEKTGSSCQILSATSLISKFKMLTKSNKTTESTLKSTSSETGFSAFSGTTDNTGKPIITNDIIENFKITLNTEARGGPLTKTEPVFSTKLTPIDICACKGVSYFVKVGDSPPNFYCQAVDSYEEKLVGCSNPVLTFRLVRASVRIPFTVMCEMHLWRLQMHHCCPRCGVFCSQGTFMQCSADESEVKMLHLYHERCRSGSEEKKLDFCLHCGITSELKVVHLDCDLISPPAFFQSQHSLILPSKARISFTSTEIPKENENIEINSDNIYKMKEGDAILSSNGLLKEQDKIELDGMLSTLNTEDISTMPDYPVCDMYTASSSGDTLKVLHMLAKGVNPNENFVDFNGSTALHAASASGHVLIAHILLQSGAVADSMNRNLRTPLMLATERNQEEVAECLVNQKAPLNTKGEVGMTCLHVAARDGHLNLCRLFIDSGHALVNAQDDGGWTPIVWASEHGHIKIVRFLIDRGGDPNIRDNEGNTALHWAAFCGTSEVCVILINHGCNINEANEHGDTPLHIAARQDNFKCIDLFLSRSANLDVENKAGESPLDCCKNDPCCKSAQAMQLSMRLKSVFEKHHHQSEKILSKDIALGRERYPIRCVNGIDDMGLDLKEFLYVTENCETCPIRIDRCITSLQHCMCIGDCTLPSCTCSAISFKCWYDPDGHLLPEFNMLDPPLLFECNRACCCDAGLCRNRVVQRGMTCRLELVRTDGKGWGVRTLKDIPKGTFICEYVGELITDSEADTRQDDSYLFDLDNKDGETYCLDARHFGNISRFINHLCEPNLIPVKVFVDHQDLSFPRIAFFSLRDIYQYEELGFDYGEKFWVIKSKSFTCSCDSEKCKYSKDTIKETLENYKRRNQEESQESGLCNL